MALPNILSTYHIRSMTGYCLNVSGNDTVANLRNVNLWDKDYTSLSL